MQRIRALLLFSLLVAAATALPACRSCSSSNQSTPDASSPPKSDASTADAVSEAAAAAVVSPNKLRLVATMNQYDSDYGVKSSVDLDGTIYITSGGTVFEAKSGGKLEPVLPIAAYVPTMPAETAPFAGFEKDDDPIGVAAKDSAGALRLFGEHRAFTVVGEKLEGPVKNLDVWTPVAFRGGIVTAEYPKGINWIEKPKGETASLRLKTSNRKFRDVKVARDGTLVASVSGLAEIGVWGPNTPPDQGELVVLTPRNEAETRECLTMPSFDGNVYVCCENIVTQNPAPTIHRLEGSTFVPAFTHTNARCLPMPSIDRAGNLYRFDWEPGSKKPENLERCTDGAAEAGAPKCETIDVDLIDARSPHYSLGFEQVRNEEGARWFELGANEERAETKLSVRSIYARAPDDVWVIGGGAVFHNRGAGRADTAPSLPSRTDARVLAQNEHPPITATGHCEHVFVELAKKDGLDAGAAIDQEKIIAVLGKRGPPVAWKLVSGRLHDRDVAGVVAWRNEYDWKADEMDKAIDKLVEAFTRDPMNVPKVYCTLPVLSRVFERKN